MWIGEPGRHLPQQHGFLHGLGPRPGFFISEQRKRCRLPGAMASLAAFLQHRQNVFGKCNRCLSVRASNGEGEQEPGTNGTETHKNPCPQYTETWAFNPP